MSTQPRVRPAAAAGAALQPAGPIVCAIDFSPTSLAALREACAEAKRTGDALHVVHAFDLMPIPPLEVSSAWGEVAALRFELEKEMDELCAAQRAPGIAIDGAVVAGAPVIAVTNVVERTGARLLVAGTHGRTGLARAALGSVAERLVRSATVSVLTVPRAEPATATEPLPVKVVLAAVKLGGDEELVLRAAHAWGDDVAIHVVHAIGSAEWTTASRAAAEVAIASAAAGLTSDAPLTCEVRCGSAVQTILEEADRCRADRIVVGTHRRGVLERFVLGSVAEQVVRRSRVPVLTVRPFGGA